MWRGRAQEVGMPKCKSRREKRSKMNEWRRDTKTRGMEKGTKILQREGITSKRSNHRNVEVNNVIGGSISSRVQRMQLQGDKDLGE